MLVRIASQSDDSAKHTHDSAGYDSSGSNLTVNALSSNKVHGICGCRSGRECGSHCVWRWTTSHDVALALLVMYHRYRGWLQICNEKSGGQHPHCVECHLQSQDIPQQVTGNSKLQHEGGVDSQHCVASSFFLPVLCLFYETSSPRNRNTCHVIILLHFCISAFLKLPADQMLSQQHQLDVCGNDEQQVSKHEAVEGNCCAPQMLRLPAN